MYKIQDLGKKNNEVVFDTDGYLYRLVWNKEFDKAKKCGYFLLNNHLDDANDIKTPTKCFFTSPVKLHHNIKKYGFIESKYVKMKFKIEDFEDQNNLIFKFDVYPDGDLVAYYKTYDFLKNFGNNFGYIKYDSVFKVEE